MAALSQWIKQDSSLTAQCCRKLYYMLRSPSIPPFRLVYVPLRILRQLLMTLWQRGASALYYTPMFKTLLASKPKDLYLYSGMPQVLGKVKITIGDNVRISGISTIVGRASARQLPQLNIGSNVDIGWQNSISVGTLVEIQDHVRLAGRVFLAGFPGHPMDASLRREGAADTDEQAQAIILQQDVWVGTGATILAGVTVGKGSIIGAGAVVTKSVPPFSLVAGNPAKVVKSLEVPHE